MKKICQYIGMAGIIVAAICLTMTLQSCGSGENKQEQPQAQPLNITIFLDLSDRLTRDMMPAQLDRDTAIIRCVGDYFINESSKDQRLLQSVNNWIILLVFHKQYRKFYGCKCKN